MGTRAEDESNSVPPRRRGGQELPDNVQDRPEQNAGYDEAVRTSTRPSGHRPNQPLIDTDLLDLDSPNDVRQVRREERAHDDAIDEAYGDNEDTTPPSQGKQKNR